MSVATRNPFALLDDDASRPSTPPTTAPKAEAAPTTQPATRGGQRGRGGPAARGGRYYQRGGARTNAPREGETAEGTTADDAAGDGKKRFNGDGRGRGRGRGRGGERGRGGRGRANDRHSATGKTDSDKKIHQGWGGDEGDSELKVEVAAATDAAVEATNESGWGDAAASTDAWGSGETPAATGDAAAAPIDGDKPAEGRRREREPEEEDNTLTLDQYKQAQKELDIVPKLETRKANEGDDSFWKDAVVLGKKDEDEDAYFVGKTRSAATKARAKREEKVFLEIDARFERPRGGRGRGSSDRGDRGRGGRGRGRGRANGSSAPALNVNDQEAFPSLA
ncbi:hypothetical protein BXZ70DRAFT_929264 [Cristinia sonorae]|uniref:Hyaluronan/mRNA-binding protein domain-containing protein n=1 Tax=Cristinia sonorae TaxID=1940300 RepID=A0A8K0US52_9AGAR|nr:hypothetical protein BXZ70DRAFT_929264 [Cristinia sonorae]